MAIFALTIPINDAGAFDLSEKIAKEHIVYVDVPEEKSADNFQLALAGDDLLYCFGSEMANDEDASIMTVKVCGLTSRYVSNGGEGEYLDRSCEPCPEEAPYSGGF